MTCGANLLVVLAVIVPAVHVNAVVVQAKQTVTPITKVLELLTKLQAQVEADGVREATEYDKYACFCKEQASNKLYAIESSETKEAELTATIADLDADIKILNTDIGKLGLAITALGLSIDRKTKARNIEHATFVTNDAEVSEAIASCEAAIEALKGSKGDLEGHVDMEVALVQLKNVATLALGLASRSNALVTDAQWSTLGHLAKAGEPGDAYDYTYHSNDIIATLEGLRLTFTKEKNDLYQAEFTANSMFEKDVLALSNEKAFKEADKLEKEKIEAYKTELKETAIDDLAAEKAAREADEKFMSVLTSDCQDKANLFDGRSSIRVKEITAISDALEVLKTGAKPNWKANRKLNGLQKAPAKVVVKSNKMASMSSPPSFVQLRGASTAAAKMRKNILAILKGSAGRLKSSVLAMAALKVEAAEDHFVKVRSMINDIIATLEAQAKAEATTKSFCDREMKAAVTTRDAEQAKVEDLKAQISTKEADKKQLEADIAELSQQISDLTKALDEATELRFDEKKDNLMVIGQAGVGQQAIEDALELLRNFYEQYALAQYTPFKSTDSDRDGNTVADLAPEYQGTTERYKGQQASSKGIIGLLSVMLSDFERTDNKVKGDEAQAVINYDAFKKKTTDDIDAKDKLKTRKEGEVSDIEDDLVTLNGNLKTAEDAHKGALDELETLSTTCVDGEETYAERIEKRQKEIEALKEAETILEDWKN